MQKKINSTLGAIALLFICSNVFSQISIVERTVRVVKNERIFEAGITTKEVNEPSLDKRYYWYSNNNIFSNLGGYHGDLLHGQYAEFSLDGALLCNGYFTLGLKDGIWKDWDETGIITCICHWNRGKLNGKVIEYAKDGEIILQENYRSGKLHGKQFYYSADTATVQRYFNGKKIIRLLNRDSDDKNQQED